MPFYLSRRRDAFQAWSGDRNSRQMVSVTGCFPWVAGGTQAGKEDRGKNIPRASRVQFINNGCMETAHISIPKHSSASVALCHHQDPAVRRHFFNPVFIALNIFDADDSR